MRMVMMMIVMMMTMMMMVMMMMIMIMIMIIIIIIVIIIFVIIIIIIIIVTVIILMGITMFVCTGTAFMTTPCKITYEFASLRKKPYEFIRSLHRRRRRRLALVQAVPISAPPTDGLGQARHPPGTPSRRLRLADFG